MVDATHHGTPLNWALFGWSNPPYGAALDRYYDVVTLLVRAGAVVSPHRIDDNAADTPFRRSLRADPRMRAALTGGRS